MKLLSLNVALFEDNNQRLKSFVKKQNADILCLQEVTRRIDLSVKSNYLSINAIDSETKDYYSFYAPTWLLSKFEKKHFHGKKHFLFDLDGIVEFGNYTKSRYPIRKGQNIFVQNHFTYVSDWTRWPEEDYRSFQVTDLLIGDTELRLINYHGIWSNNKIGNEKTKKACEIIRKFGLETNSAVIICGDFNLFPNTDSIQVLNQHFNNLCNSYNIQTTRPESNELNNKPRNVVDYIFTNEKVRINSFEVLDSDVSDHLPLLLDFSF